MGLIDDVKKIEDIVAKTDQIELRSNIVDLKSDILDLTEENRNLKQENQDLRELLEVNAKMVFKEPVYYQEGDETPFCPRCWEIDKQTVHLILSNWNDRTRYYCSQCKSVYEWDIKPRNNDSYTQDSDLFYER